MWIKSLWGMEGSLEEQFERIHLAGYQGIETGLPAHEDTNRFKELLYKHEMIYIPLIGTSGSDHISSFRHQAERAAQFKPLLINCHSAKDSMPFKEQVLFFENAVEFESELGVAVGHETHRGRALFNPWVTSSILREVPDLKLTADLSHWCCVCESLLEDQSEHLAQVFERTIYIHGRVGYAQGPQVPHPGAPEYALELSSHLSWWRQIYQIHSARGQQSVPFCPEYGPPGYMHTLPFTNMPVSDAWDVCRWMIEYMKKDILS
ncbi:sugar phosphate isomerase/epimerase [Cohnella sp. WQ 127256]|uniref:sugar phosphate isomerase/epimerase family protein n=1 Tax=Cohnella sp. WQ 127256 TaxID=2938790 RepID=UPI002118808E|nr:sugar phosphate isomerase/epimerase [Cohnella sp. WQ 127256]